MKHNFLKGLMTELIILVGRSMLDIRYYFAGDPINTLKAA